MVFATDFDPTHASARRQSAQSASLVKLDPIPHPIPVDPIASSADQASRVATSSTAASIDVTTEVTTLPLKAKPSLPLWLQVLNKVQHGSTAVATLLIAGALVLYGSSVYTNKLTDRALTRLDRLQSESQQLTAANEAMKQSLAEQAMQEGSGLEPYEAGDVLFVTPEPVRPAKATVESKPERIRPLGY